MKISHFVGNVSAGVTSFTNLNLQASTQYFYRVTAYINGGQSSEISGEASATTLPIPPPVPPTNLTIASNTLNTVSLTWSDESEVESGFRVYRKVGTGAFFELGTVNKDVTYFNDASVAGPKQYTFRVVSFNSSGESIPSNEVSIDIPASVSNPDTPVPGSPSNLLANLVDAKHIALTWGR